MPAAARTGATGIFHLNNNRQGGRRRGRGGQRPQGMPGNSGGNARDNRQRGNAAQLLEKYKNLARDAQLAGDRVQTEYYLQFADHYFRVLEEHRSRFEEQNAHRRRRDEDEDDLDGDDELTAEAEADGDDDGDVEIRQRPRGRERDRGDRAQRQRNNGAHQAEADASDERIEMAFLPPAIGASDDSSEEEAAPKPRRRTRRPKAEGDEAAA